MLHHVGVVAKMLRAAEMAHERDDNPTVEKTHSPTISHSHVSLVGYFGKCTFIGPYQQICGKNFPSTDRSNLALTKFIAKLKNKVLHHQILGYINPCTC